MGGLRGILAFIQNCCIFPQIRKHTNKFVCGERLRQRHSHSRQHVDSRSLRYYLRLGTKPSVRALESNAKTTDRTSAFCSRNAPSRSCHWRWCSNILAKVAEWPTTTILVSGRSRRYRRNFLMRRSISSSVSRSPQSCAEQGCGSASVSMSEKLTCGKSS